MYACISGGHLCCDTRICLRSKSTQKKSESRWRNEVLNPTILEARPSCPFQCHEPVKAGFFLVVSFWLLAAKCPDHSEGLSESLCPWASCRSSPLWLAWKRPVSALCGSTWQEDSLANAAYNSPSPRGKNLRTVPGGQPRRLNSWTIFPL